jgi:Gram-negative bacterial TonB protein C-terminal
MGELQAKLIFGFAITMAAMAFGQNDSTSQRNVINDKDINVVQFEELKYPAIAEYAPFESDGVEVFLVTLDDQGKVVQVEPLFGNNLFVPDCIANLKKWRFQPNADKKAIVVYRLKLSSGICKTASSVFTLRVPNLVTVTGCLPVVFTRPFEFARFEEPAMISDTDVRIIHFDNQLKYPRVARLARVEGLVVLKLVLDDKGGVSEVLPLSGLPILIPDCVSNARNWRFEPNSKKTIILVYNFSLVPDDPGQVFFQPPNLVTVSDSPIAAQPDR